MGTTMMHNMMMRMMSPVLSPPELHAPPAGHLQPRFNAISFKEMASSSTVSAGRAARQHLQGSSVFRGLLRDSIPIAFAKSRTSGTSGTSAASPRHEDGRIDLSDDNDSNTFSSSPASSSEEPERLPSQQR